MLGLSMDSFIEVICSRGQFCSWDFQSSCKLVGLRLCFSLNWPTLLYSFVIQGLGVLFKCPSLEVWVCLGLLQLPKVPTIGLRGSILQHGTDLNWLLSEMPFCNPDEWPRE